MLHHPAGFARSKSRADVHRSSPPAACSFRFLSYVHGPSVALFLSLSLSSPRSYIPEARLPVVRRRTTRTFPRLSFTVRVFSLYIYNISISLSSQITKRALVLFFPRRFSPSRTTTTTTAWGVKKPLCSSEGPRTKQKTIDERTDERTG